MCRGTTQDPDRSRHGGLCPWPYPPPGDRAVDRQSAHRLDVSSARLCAATTTAQTLLIASTTQSGQSKQSHVPPAQTPSHACAPLRPRASSPPSFVGCPPAPACGRLGVLPLPALPRRAPHGCAA
eukprot:scaffold144969_cov28-Tisochrysis_lutea.AAC.2